MAYSNSNTSPRQVRSGLMVITVIAYVGLLTILTLDLADTTIFSMVVAGVGTCAVGVASRCSRL